jgi:hypothetical protein
MQQMPKKAKLCVSLPQTELPTIILGRDLGMSPKVFDGLIGECRHFDVQLLHSTTPLSRKGGLRYKQVGSAFPGYFTFFLRRLRSREFRLVLLLNGSNSTI